MAVKKLDVRVEAVEEKLGSFQTEVQAEILRGIEPVLLRQQTMEQNLSAIMQKLDAMAIERNTDSRVGTEMLPNRKAPVDFSAVASGSSAIEVDPGGEPSGRGERGVRRLEMPVFDGDNPDGWIFRAERYFQMSRMGEPEKLDTAIISFDGEALSWFQWEDRRRPIQSWAELKLLIVKRFRPSQDGTLSEKFLALRQTGTVRNYRRQFEILAAPIGDIPEPVLEGHFINGLKPEVKAEVRLLAPDGLGRVMEVAQRVEDKLAILQQARGYHGSGGNRSNYSPGPNPPIQPITGVRTFGVSLLVAGFDETGPQL